jgi:predicted RNA-binding Zn-ribbon protein involved in translation (DUF1610 family)
MSTVETRSEWFNDDGGSIMMGIAASHTRCDACGNLTEIDVAADTSSATCSACGAPSESLAAVAVVPCPEAGEADRACHASEHEQATGMHVVEVD